MKAWRLGIAAVILVVLAWGGWFLLANRAANVAPNTSLTVAATIFPLADIVQQVGGERVGVVLLIPPGVSEHSVALSPQTLAQLEQARTVFAIGQGLDDALVERVTAARSVPVATVEGGIALREFEEEAEHPGEEGEEHGDVDPHYWLTVPNAMKIAQTVAEELAVLDPAGATEYGDRLDAYLQRLETLEAELQAQAAAASQKNFVAAHDAWSYFADHYGFTLVATYEPVEGQTPSAADLARIRGLVQQYGITTFYAEPQKTDSTETGFLEREFGLKIAELDPVGGLKANDSYEAMMRRNVAAIAYGS